ncbi:HTH-type transcriptional activator AllS [Pseudovibrio axinellae]|uniref:HTH-type transcriptional activator AllS n=1 Tax=Pseudovibrio axinellae TaxID=989403 RepID=A0A161V8S1_9HYPH|nr:LysR family transcriptional regulator [Pseudovibrio axinellae]KZL21379.1 HTH-type transcriptional activator AllS [Pseudovibrio axinellae]SEQ98062.1 transcriptional regulator, LysR family [Pseudovibrio axinellae]
MTFEQLVVLDAIVSAGTFRGAAEHLNKAQSAVSHMLKKLEDEIGFQLLSREDYRPKLTPRGEVFYRHSTRVLRRMRDLKSIAQNLNSDHEAEVLLSVSSTYQLPPLLKLIGKLTCEFPATHIRLSRDSMGGPLERLLSEEAQIIITTLDEVPMDLVEAVPLTPITMLPVAHRDFPAAEDNGFRTMVEMQNYVQVVVADSSQSKEQSRGLMPGGLRWTVSDFATKKEILLENMGWGGMPDYMIEKELEQGTLVALNVEGYAATPVLHYVMRRRDIPAGTVAQAIWEQIANQ